MKNYLLLTASIAALAFPLLSLADGEKIVLDDIIADDHDDEHTRLIVGVDIIDPTVLRGGDNVGVPVVVVGGTKVVTDVTVGDKTDDMVEKTDDMVDDADTKVDLPETTGDIRIFQTVGGVGPMMNDSEPAVVVPQPKVDPVSAPAPEREEKVSLELDEVAVKALDLAKGSAKAQGFAVGKKMTAVSSAKTAVKSGKRIFLK
jgi:hypothetical protein